MRLPAVLVLLSVSIGTLASDAAAEMPAPFTVVRARGAYVRVAIGEERTRGGLLRLATVVTPDGAVPAVLDRIERVCTTLCSDEDGETCHFEAIVRMERPVRGAIAVFPGRLDVSAIVAMPAGPEQPAPADPRWAQAPPAGVDLASCSEQRAGPFVTLSCRNHEEERLYEDRTQVVVSVSDYTKPTARAQYQLRIDGVEAFLIQYGLKAEIVTAVIVKVNGTWQVHYRDADYPLLC